MNNEQLKKVKSLFINGGIYMVLLLLFLIIVLKDPTFLKFRNVVNILTQSSVKIIIALGVAGIIVTQGTDLSAGRQIGIAGLLSASLLQSVSNPNKIYKFVEKAPGIKGVISSMAKGLGFADEVTFVQVFITILLVVLVGAFIGMLNGILVSKFNIVPFVVTMGMMIIAYGANSLYFDFTGSTPVAGFAPAYQKVVGSIPLGSYHLPN